MKWIVLGIAVLVGAISVVPAHAQWIHQSEDDAFAESTQHMSVTASSGYGLAFRCSDEEELTLLFMTPESTESDSVESVNMIGAEILVRTDDKAVIKIRGEAIAMGNGNLALLTRDDGVVQAARQSAEATGRIAIAVEVAGKRFHAHNFSVGGSTDAINKTLTGCDVPLD